MYFKSDNTSEVSSQIMKAIVEANCGHVPSYGNDDLTKKLEDVLAEIFETPVWFCLNSTGTASNSLALSLIARPYEGVLCHEEAHVIHDECNAPNRFTGGARLYGLSGNKGKIDFDQLQKTTDHALSMKPHVSFPTALTVSQATECGTVYTLTELEDIGHFARERGINVHMDGARFANALQTLNCTPAQMTWKSGVKLLSLGATKNGALSAEALLVFDEGIAQNLKYAHKSMGQLFSKNRFFAAQFLAYFQEDLWLKNAKIANEAALKLTTIFKKFGYENFYPVEANALFIKLDGKIGSYLSENGVGFYPWTKTTPNLYRFVCSCFTTDQELKDFETLLSHF